MSEKGDAKGRFEFAISWVTGADKNMDEAKEWIEKAIDVVDGDDVLGSEEAIMDLWIRLDRQHSLSAEEKVELGSVFALFVLNRDVEDDAMKDEKGKNFLKLLEKARLGESGAQCELAKLYYLGKEGVMEDNKRAFYWFMKSARQGNRIAQFYIGECYRRGDGIDEDKDEAKEWYQKAAEQGDKDAKEALETLTLS